MASAICPLNHPPHTPLTDARLPERGAPGNLPQPLTPLLTAPRASPGKPYLNHPPRYHCDHHLLLPCGTPALSLSLSFSLSASLSLSVCLSVSLYPAASSTT